MSTTLSDSAALLSAPFTLACGATLKNRIAKSAMSETLGTATNAPSDALARLYGRWADGGLGLCITGNVMVDRNAIGEPGNVVIEDDRDLAALERWAQAGTRNGTHLWMQINHPGKQSPRGLNRETVAPSAVPFEPAIAPFFGTPRELRVDEIEAIVKRFARAASVAKRAGFSGVQIHGAHGYLVSQFLSPHHNRRADAYGGSIENRRRFVLEVLAAIRAEVCRDYPVGIKLNSADFQRGGITEDEALGTIEALVAGGIDLVEISGGTYEAPAMTGVIKDSTREREAYFLAFAERARKVTSIPLMVTGGFRTRAGMTSALESGAVDVVGLARLLAVEPDLPLRVLAGNDPKHAIGPVRTGINAIDKMGLMEVNWYTHQLKRMGEGRDPKPNESVLKIFALGMLHLQSTVAGRRFRRLRA
jgi:2,4-dienoyl-CoA reductase-like NADH-dependent reductase (Old Yellow Enzyme family)